MRVLLVTYYFPPAGGGGVQRALGWCRHLPPLGVQVTVVALDEPHWIDQDTTLVIPPSTKLLRTHDPSPAALIPNDALARVHGIRRLARRIALQPRRLAVPDIHRAWRRPAAAAAVAQARTSQRSGEPIWDVVISSSPPETTHLIAADIAAALDIPWIADYRDSWLDLPHLRLDRRTVRIKHALNRRLANRLMRTAAAATTVSEPLARDLRQRHPHLDVTVIENGIELDEVRRAHARADGFRDPGSFVVAYTGNFFGRQSASSFLAAVEQAAAAEPELAEQLLVRFVGTLKPEHHAQIAGSTTLTSCVEHVAFLRHDDVLAQQRAADLLLLYVAPGRGSAGVYTGKVFEYVASLRPVLCLAPDGNVAATLLSRAGSTHAGGGTRVDPDDVDAIAGALIDAWRTWRASPGQRTPDITVEPDLLQELERSTGAARLHALARRVIDEHPG